MYTISQLAKRFKLSRSTLLYYESIGLLLSSGLGKNGYRLYSEREEKRLQRICMFREMRIPLKKIKKLLGTEKGDVRKALEEQLLKLNEEIKRLRLQQQSIVRMLQDPKLLRLTRSMDKDGWVEMFKAAGVSDESMLKFHQEFERNAPEAHQDFLESIGIPTDEVIKMRRKLKEKSPSRKTASANSN
ncbi:MAG: hypothetical protein A2X49_00415 [Lentisphaerae bacterium GWF2_52_8]|nr:MAG: hypothetical protein A2X49_00415 [Lentisphaerae bacterium GWF2_52_8]